jgi:hypothetical protein
MTPKGLWEGSADELKAPAPTKTASASDDLLQRLATHESAEWYDTMEQGLPQGFREQYQMRIAAAQHLQNEVMQKAGDPSVEYSLRDHLHHHLAALSAEVEFCRERLANQDYYASEEDLSYLDSQPRYQFGRSAIGSDMGPGGFDAIASAAEEAITERESRDWKMIMTSGAELFVEEQHPLLMGDTAEMRRVARRHINSLTSHLSQEDARPIRNQFLAQVEKTRRVAARDLGKTLPKEANNTSYEGPDEGLFA